ncbi:TPA: lipopolysaccharide biosynthesis protein [Aeromonas veronii]
MSTYWKHVSQVFSGAVGAQLIPIVGTFFITRVYTPSDFGLYSSWLSIVLTLAVIITLRFEAALAMEEDGEGRNIAVFSILLTVFALGFVISFILFFVWYFFPHIFNLYTFGPIWTVMLASVLLAANTTWQNWASADREYKKLNLIRLALASIVTFFQVGMGYWSASELTLILAHLLGLILSFILCFFIKPLHLKIDKNLWLSILSFWRSRKRFPLLSLPADLISAISAQLPVLIITSRFGADIGGVLALTMRILGAPIGILGKAILDVFRRYAATEYKETKSCRAIYIKTFNVLCLGSILLIIGVIIFGEFIFSFAFGEEWSAAGVYAMWLLPMFALRFIASPLSYTIYIVEKLHFDLLWQVILLIVTVLSLYIFTGYRNTLIYYSIGYSIMYIIYLIVTYRLSKKI